MLLVALGRGRLPGILDINARNPFVVFGTMDGKVLAGLTACVVGSTSSALPVYFYETGWIIPRRLVAVGNLDKVWIAVPKDVAAEELQDSFRNYFDAQWATVLDVAEKSFTYNAFNNAYFAVRNLHPLENLTLEQLLEKTGIGSPPNIIVSWLASVIRSLNRFEIYTGSIDRFKSSQPVKENLSLSKFQHYYPILELDQVEFAKDKICMFHFCEYLIFCDMKTKSHRNNSI